jgi:hypothetical protein
MPEVATFYSISEIQKQLANRVHHSNSACPRGRDIPSWERRPGTGKFKLCGDCRRLNRETRAAPKENVVA